MRGLNIVNDDLVITNNSFEWVEDDILISVNRRLTTRLNEFFLDINMGLDHDEIFIKKYSKDRIRQAVNDCVMQEERVSNIYDIKIDVKDRHVKVDFKFSTDQGEFESEVVI